MLVLSRQRDESIKIGDDIEITVVDIRGEKVRLGINAPPHVPVHRKEVYEAIKRELEAKGAVDTSPESLAGKAEASRQALQLSAASSEQPTPDVSAESETLPKE